MSASDSVTQSGLDDEFDALPNDWDDAELQTLLRLCDDNQPAEHTGEIEQATYNSPSSEYSFDGEIDDALLAHVAQLEAAEIQNAAAAETEAPSSTLAGPSTCPTSPTLKPCANNGDEPSPRPSSLKRALTSPSSSSPARKKRNRNRKGKRKQDELKVPSDAPTKEETDKTRSPRSAAKDVKVSSSPSTVKSKRKESSQTVKKVLAELEDEMTCPICCDLFVCAHLGNPCGHSFCGECGWDWISKHKNAPTCASCRCPLSTDMPMIPNFQLDSTVRKHIEALRKSGEEGWGECGAHYLEWTEREARWKANADERARVLEEIRHPPDRAPARNTRGSRRRAVIIDLSSEPVG